MKKKFKSIALIILVFAASVVAASTAFAQKPQNLTKSDREFLRGGRTDTRAEKANALPGAVSPANRTTYQIGKTFSCVIDDSKYMKEEDDLFNYVVVDLVYLIDDLEGQPESQQLQAILKGIIRNTKDLSIVSGEIAAVSKSYFARLNPEKKWYFNVGSSQMNLLIAGWSKDNVGAVKSLKEFQVLVSTAPQGTPQIVLAAMQELSNYSIKVKLTPDDFTALVTDTKAITTMVYV